MGAPLTYDYTQKLFDTRRQPRDFKAYKTDTHLTKRADGSFLFSFMQYEWTYNKSKGIHERSKTRAVTPLCSIDQDNVVTLLIGDKGWPSVAHMTIRNRLMDITGFDIYSDTCHHKSKDTAIRITGRHYSANGWAKQPWCAHSADKTIPYVAGTQFKTITNGRLGGLTECLNPPKDMKKLVKPEAIQQVKAETAVIRKLAKVMLRVGFDEYIEKRIDRHWGLKIDTKKLSEVNYLNPTGDDAMAVLKVGYDMANRPDDTIFDSTQGKYVARPRDVQIQILRERVLENGMKALRQHIYTTTDGYEKVEVK